MFLLPLAWGIELARGQRDGVEEVRAGRAGRRADDRDALPHRILRAALDRRVRDRRLARIAATHRARGAGVRRSGARRLVGGGAAHHRRRVLQPAASSTRTRSGSTPTAHRRRSAWLFTGQLFDYGRFPIVSLLVAIGIVVCVCRFRSDVRARALLGLMAMSFVLFSGRPTFGFILNLLPGNADLFLSRYMMGIQLAGDMLAGVGLAWAGESIFTGRARRGRPRVRPVPIAAGLMAAAVLLTLPALAQPRRLRGERLRRASALQVESDQTDGAALDVLINDITARGGGRTYAGLPGNWGAAVRDRSGAGLRVSGRQRRRRVRFRAAHAVAARRQRGVLQPGRSRAVSAVQHPLHPDADRHDAAGAGHAAGASGRHRLYSGRHHRLPRRSSTPPASSRPTGATWRRRCSRSFGPPAFQQGELATIAFDGGAAAAPTLPVDRDTQVAAPARAPTSSSRHRTATSRAA